MDNFFKYNDDWKKKYLSRDMLSKDYDLFVDEVTTNGVGRDIFYFPCFRPEFCDKIIDYANKLNMWGKMGHTSYRTNDTWLRHIGMDDVWNDFLSEYVIDLVEYVYKTTELNKHLSKEYQYSQGNVEHSNDDNSQAENFLVRYLPDEANDSLSLHCDDSEISVQVSLNSPSDFEGGGTWYPKQQTLLKLPKGYMSAHPGAPGFRHGARRITKGVRYTLVSFIQN